MGSRSARLPGKGWAPQAPITPRGTGTGRPDIWMGEARTAQGARPGARYKVRQRSGFKGFTKRDAVDAMMAAISTRMTGG